MAKRKRPINGHAAKVYGTYIFKDKDPIIAATQEVFDKSGLSYSDVHKVSGVSATTMRNWFKGPTKRPSFCCVNAVGRACGQTLAWTPYKER